MGFIKTFSYKNTAYFDLFPHTLPFLFILAPLLLFFCISPGSFTSTFGVYVGGRGVSIA